MEMLALSAILMAGVIIVWRRKIYHNQSTRPPADYGDRFQACDMVGCEADTAPNAPWRYYIGYVRRGHVGTLSCSKCRISMDSWKIEEYRRKHNLPNDQLPAHPLVGKNGQLTPPPHTWKYTSQ